MCVCIYIHIHIYTYINTRARACARTHTYIHHTRMKRKVAAQHTKGLQHLFLTLEIES
jgi:hypothetical protein